MCKDAMVAGGLTEKRAALIVGHPGHELRVHGWMEAARPDVVVLTDGSGGAGVSRLASTERILRSTGCRAASIFGEFSDRRVYELVLNHRYDVFCRLVDRIAFHLRAHRIDYVVGDACESFNPTHDICRLLIGAALERLRSRHGIELATYDFKLCGRPDELGVSDRNGAIEWAVDAEAFQRKADAARRYHELRGEVEDVVNRIGWDAFRSEWLRPVAFNAGYAPPAEKPYYETYGEQQVAAGRYSHVLRYTRHIRPLGEALWNYARLPSRSAA